MGLFLNKFTCQKYYSNTNQTGVNSFEIASGTSLGLLGSNGAGKTSFLNLLAGEYDGLSGRCELDGIDLLNAPEEYKAKVGYCSDILPYQHDWHLSEFLRLCCRIKNIEPTDDFLTRLLVHFELLELRNQRIKTLSLGQRQRLNFAQASINSPSLLLLDEPLNGLDSRQQQEFWKWFSTQQSIKVLASHSIHDLVQHCDRLFIIDRHQVVADILCHASTTITALTTSHEKTNTGHPRLLIHEEGEEVPTEAILATGSIEKVLPQLFSLTKKGEWKW